MCKELKLKVFSLGLLILLMACDNKDESQSKPVNSFKMNVNNQLWEPSRLPNGPCYVAYVCTVSGLNQVPFYTIKAFQDANYKTSYSSDNVFELKIMNVLDTGVYHISDAYGDFNSYTRFIINKPGSRKIYQNSTARQTAKVHVEGFIKTKGSGLIGIKGSFSGTLFNTDDPKDSIVINDCRFTFKKVNWGDFCQCDECQE